MSICYRCHQVLATKTAYKEAVLPPSSSKSGGLWDPSISRGRLAYARVTNNSSLLSPLLSQLQPRQLSKLEGFFPPLFSERELGIAHQLLRIWPPVTAHWPDLVKYPYPSGGGAWNVLSDFQEGDGKIGEHQ